MSSLEGHSGTESSLTSNTTPTDDSEQQNEGDLKSTIRAFEKLARTNSALNASTASQLSRRRQLGPLGKSPAGTLSLFSMDQKKEGDAVRVLVLSANDAGLIRITSTTTLGELRKLIADRLGHNNFMFQDAQSKRPLSSESLPVHASKGPILVAQTGLDNLLADATLRDPHNSSVSREAAAFKVFWWDASAHANRLVWLKFDSSSINVSSRGSSFRLFDPSGLRFPLVFTGIRGSDKGFQIVNALNRRASRFFAQSSEQKNLISVHFCFVWRPNVIRRGLMPPLDADLMKVENAQDAIEPRSFVNLLRRHIIEVDRMVGELERTMDTALVRHYLTLFASMFQGGYELKNGDMSPLSNSELESFGKASKLMQDWQDKIAKKRNEKGEDPNAPAGAPGSAKSSKRTTEETVAFDNFFEDITDPFNYNSEDPALKSVGGDTPAPVIGGDGIPPPPPPPAPSALVMKPAICPVNFDGISASEIAGTIWAEMNRGLQDNVQKRLESDLRILFGRDARDRSISQKDSDGDGILETARLRNLEVLLFMEELKGLNFDDIIDLILKFDSRIFRSTILDRLMRKAPRDSSDSSSAPTTMCALLPTAKEAEALTAHFEKHGQDGLRPGEIFFLHLCRRVPDRSQRFEFGYWMCKIESEISELDDYLSVISEAIDVVKGSEKFKSALRIVLDILTTLTPRFGLTRGFRISSFNSSVERVSGTVSNPTIGESSQNPPSVGNEQGAAQGETSKDGALQKPSNRAAKLAKLRQKVAKREEEFWHVRLHEYMTVFMNRFDVCQGFWLDLVGPCSDAMRIDLASIDIQTSEWAAQVEVMKLWKEESGGETTKSGDLFQSAVSRFIDAMSKSISAKREKVISIKASVDALWKWLGEVMGSEPTLIFKHIHDFANNFKAQWKLCESNWDHKRTLVLRGVLKLQKPPPAPEKTKSPRTSKTTKKTLTVRPLTSDMSHELTGNGATEPIEEVVEQEEEVAPTLSSQGEEEIVAEIPTTPEASSVTVSAAPPSNTPSPTEITNGNGKKSKKKDKSAKKLEKAEKKTAKTKKHDAPPVRPSGSAPTFAETPTMTQTPSPTLLAAASSSSASSGAPVVAVSEVVEVPPKDKKSASGKKTKKKKK